MTRHKKNPAAGRASRARDTFEVLPTPNDPQISRPVASLQSDFVARRFGLAPHMGALVACLAFRERA
jgi:hypothetical protein